MIDVVVVIIIKVSKILSGPIPESQTVRAGVSASEMVNTVDD